MKQCCHNCNKRAIGCHSECEDYKAYKTALEEQKAKISRENGAIEYEAYRVIKYGAIKREQNLQPRRKEWDNG